MPANQYIGQRQRRGGLLFLVIAALILLISARYIASTILDYAWWSELHQLDTWVSLLIYGTGPLAIAAVLFFMVFFLAFKLGIHSSTDAVLFGVVPRPIVNRIALVVFTLLALGAANASLDSWTVVRFFGGLRLPPTAGEFVDPIFREPLHFYFFGLPFYNMLLRVVLVAAVLSLLIYWAAAHLETFSRRMPSFSNGSTFDFEGLRFGDAFQSQFVRLVAAVVLLALAAKFYFNRYDFLLEDHSAYLVGVNWITDRVVLPLQWLMIVGSLSAAGLVLARRGRLALLLLLILPVRYVLPPIIAGLYVRPNELALERPYIQHHIEATRSAYGLNRRVKETALEAAPDIPIDYAKHKPLLDNVRLWDWRAFHDTISQIQPLRPYVYHDTDVDRYDIDGQIRQVLISPRELEIRQLGTAGGGWINTHLMYTHGYGIVMAEANRITSDGLPQLFIKNAPPEVTTKSLKFTHPELYYSEVAHEPVFVNTGQQEFNFPSGSESVYTKYAGTGGFPISSPLMRLAAAVEYGDMNILLTSYFNEKSRMMIHRPVLDRLQRLAGFLTWDSDPYLVLTDSGRLVWMVDGYMSSTRHPYSRELAFESGLALNYMRNSVKAAVDAYTGETNMYVFDPGDVLIQAYWRLFPALLKPASAMPADLRRHARYPETLFSAQAEMYRTYHMRDAESFYNRADLWDLARTGSRQGESGAAAVSPTYVVANLPGSDRPEFLLMIPFTPANKDNLIGLMSARCDGEHLGEVVIEQLSKQNIVYGPMQVDARINQDQNISKDLSLWNQQGSQVLRGQTLVLPIENSFLYVEPIYIQASQASMPQLKKVALAMGNRLVYADTYEQALSQLIEASGGTGPTAQSTTAPSTAQTTNAPAQISAANPGTGTAVPTDQALQTVRQIRDHLQRYRDLSAQGKWAEAGRELDEIQRLVQK